ncbi:MAG: pseudooxynicotine oxidase, partial [Gaiellales bacterium]|nr:pseudooxynicotine oxidase [Gaiellales bacterium]
GGGFAGVTAAREAARGGAQTVLLEARDRLGGRTWTAPWNGLDIEYGGGWVHWHQPFTWSEIVRANLAVDVDPDADEAAWWVSGTRRTGTVADRDAIAERGWNQFVEGVEDVLPEPHNPLARRDLIERIDSQTIAERIAELDLSEEEHELLWAELESLAHGRLDDAGAVSVLRWHALAGYSLALTQFTGGRVTLAKGTRSLLEAIAAGAAFETRLSTPVAAIRQFPGRVEVTTRDGDELTARAVVVAVPLNTLGGIEFTPELSPRKQEGIALGQASRGVKIFIRAEGPYLQASAIQRGHPFGHIATEHLLGSSQQILIGFGHDAELCDAKDIAMVQRQMDDIIPGYRVLDATANDWLGDEFSSGTWAIHRPGWYSHYHAEMRRPEGRVVLAGSDIANGWAGFIDGAIESGFRGASLALEAARNSAADLAEAS